MSHKMTFSLSFFIYKPSTERATLEATRSGTAELLCRPPGAAVAWRDGGERAK